MSASTSDTWGIVEMVKFLRKLGRDTSGATAVEYGLILALIFLAMIGAVQSFGTEAISMWTRVGNTVSTAVGV
jgi:pilus assembly protein Flp/PilA